MGGKNALFRKPPMEDVACNNTKKMIHQDVFSLSLLYNNAYL